MRSSRRWLIALPLAVLAVTVLVRAARFTPRQVALVPAEPFEPLPGSVERLSGAVRIPTVSPSDAAQRSPAAFLALHAYLAQAFPRFHAEARREVVGRDALLYTWMGTDGGLRPILLMGHMDVVPVEAAGNAGWSYPPFSGAIAEGYVWGRGTLDDKGTVLGLLEACETLLAHGFRPRRTVILSFGADEEVGGTEGAARIVALLRSREVRPQLVLDEGGSVVTGAVPGVSAPVALVGIAEKGYVSVELAVGAEGGHSSMPPRHTAAGVLARAVTRLEEHPFPGGVRGATAALFDAIGREMSFGRRVLFANRWLFDPLIERQLAGSPVTDAALRTTTAVTMLEGSPKDNVLPSRARAVVNFRILPGESVAGVLERVRRVVRDPRVQVRRLGFAVEPSPISPVNDPIWAQLEGTIHQVYSDAVVAPYLVLGGTDSRYFHDLTPNVYRFAAMRLVVADLARIHGINERISAVGYLEGVRFLAQLIRNTAGGQPSGASSSEVRR
jgi:carboxypeptidase PM20D1